MTAREAQAAYQRKWRAANKEKVREQQRRYWQRRAERETREAEEAMYREVEQMQGVRDGGGEDE